MAIIALAVLGLVIFAVVRGVEYSQNQNRQRRHRHLMEEYEETRRDLAEHAKKRRAERERLLGIEEREVRGVVEAAARSHLEVLARKIRQSAIVDDYGNWDMAGWEREKRYFLEQVVRDQGAVERHWDLSLDIVESVVLEELRNNHEDFYLAMTGMQDSVAAAALSAADFESDCADRLRAAGWSARVVGGTGDQGADVIAERDGVRVLFQCKRYAERVGNKAVQEAFAGKAFHETDAACVVSVVGFTKSAWQLSMATRVFLLVPDQLSDIFRLVRQEVRAVGQR